MEYAVILPPWPEWMGVKLPSSKTAVVAVAARVISAHAGDALDPECVTALLGAMLDSNARIHAWLYAFSDYRRRVLQAIGEEAIRGFSTNENTDMSPNPPLDILENGPPGLIAVSCTAGQLSTVGLPPGFLRQCDDTDHIGAYPSAGYDVDWSRYPTTDEMIDNYKLIIFAGGEHHSDCLIASNAVDGAALSELMRVSAAKLGLEAGYLGSVEGKAYDDLYRRTL